MSPADLFGGGAPAEDAPAPGRPLADRLRPERMDDVVGQRHLLAPGAPLARMVESGRVASTILWGPPGVGKTTLARLLAGVGDCAFVQISAIFSGVADLRRAFDAAQAERRRGRATLLFVDEIHRFNRAQQDGFLPHMESGAIILVGATTENPSFSLNAALLSRAQVLVLEALSPDDLEALLARAETAVGRALPLDAEARVLLKEMSGGDGRALINLAESAFALAGSNDPLIDPKALSERLARRAALYDKSGDGHYGLISALHKAVRGSDPDAALYWLKRMLSAGEDPLFLARRLIRMASEDIGLADPAALPQAIAARDAYQALGSPEGELALAQATIYLAAAPKSNAVYVADKAAARSAKSSGSAAPPTHAVNAPTKLIKEQGYSAGYVYDHDAPDGFAGLNYFPNDMARERFYEPVERGFEREMRKRLAYFEKVRRERDA